MLEELRKLSKHYKGISSKELEKITPLYIALDLDKDDFAKILDGGRA